jgi:UDP-glucose 6-dehydrogenase
MGAKVRVYDPVWMEQAKHVLTDVTYCVGPYDCVEEADAVVIGMGTVLRARPQASARPDGLPGDG